MPYQNSGSQPARGTRGPRRGRREGEPAWTAAAATDPDGAERIAQSITDAYSKTLALTDIAEAVAAVDLAAPHKGERPVEQVHDGVACTARILDWRVDLRFRQQA